MIPYKEFGLQLSFSTWTPRVMVYSEGFGAMQGFRAHRLKEIGVEAERKGVGDSSLYRTLRV